MTFGAAKEKLEGTDTCSAFKVQVVNEPNNTRYICSHHCEMACTLMWCGVHTLHTLRSLLQLHHIKTVGERHCRFRVTHIVCVLFFLAT